MPRISFTLVCVAALCSALILLKLSTATETGPSDQSLPTDTNELLTDVESYRDLDFGFSFAVPSGWQKIVSVESEEDLEILEPGYAVGFESPNQGDNDLFADYILIEILPGSESGLFETDGVHRRPVSIDGQATWFDKVDIDSGSTGIDDVDLTVYQAELIGLGYTVGLYAIGEQSRTKLMAAAFEVLVRTFTLEAAPFVVL